MKIKIYLSTILLLLIAILVQQCSKPPCDIVCPDTAYVDTDNCICRCDAGYCGDNCEFEIALCNEHGTYYSNMINDNCNCECDPGWCGFMCVVEMLDCQNGGIWNEENCACDCPPGLTGPTCEDFIEIGDDEDVIRFDIVQVEDGQETLLETVLLSDLEEEWHPTDFIDGWPPLISVAWGDEDEPSQLWLNFPDLIEVGTYLIDPDDLYSQIIYDPEGIDYFGEAAEGSVEITNTDGFFHGTFELLMTDGYTNNDTLKVVNGFFNSTEQ